MTWFDHLIFDREWHRLLKPHHPRSTVPYILPINLFLFTLGVAALANGVIWLVT